MRAVGGLFPVDYTDDYWLTADEEAAKSLKNTEMELKSRLNSLVRAYWFKSAHKMLQEATKKTPDMPRAWAMRAEIAQSIGLLDDAEQAARMAIKLDKNMQKHEEKARNDPKGA